MNQILADIAAERVRQDCAWGSCRNLSDLEWLPILGEERGEVCKAINNNDAVNLREELIHEAATCIEWIECLDRRMKVVPGFPRKTTRDVFTAR